MIQETRIEATETEVRRAPGVYEAAVPDVLPQSIARLSWGALIAGAVVAIASQAFFAVLGVAIGLSLAPVTPATGLAVGAGIWWMLTALVSLFLGGYVAGRFAYIRHPFHSSMHGIMTWCLVTVLSILFVGWLGGVVAAGPMGAIVDDLAPQQQQTQMMGEPARAGAMEADAEAAAIGTAWWTFLALLLGIAAAGFGGYLASPANLREAGGGLRGTVRNANASDR